MLRVYFNRRADFPLVWSVDRGPGTQELNFREVHFAGGLAYTVYQPDAGDGSGSAGEDLLAPRAWIQFDEAGLVALAIGDRALIVVAADRRKGLGESRLGSHNRACRVTKSNKSNRTGSGIQRGLRKSPVPRAEGISRASIKGAASRGRGKTRR